LRTYQRWRRHPPTSGSVLIKNLQPLGLLALCCIGAGFLFYVVRLPAISFLLAGFWLGQFIGEIARIRTVPVVWSVLEHVLDWSKVERAIARRRFEERDEGGSVEDE
jgi:hypothetical protein